MSTKRVLDLGSGLNPDYRATDMVDYQKENAKVLIHEEKNHFKFQIRPLGMSESRIKELQNYRDTHINAKWGVNYNARLPYPDNTFDIIVSHASLAAFGELKAYKEAYRVLKRDGIIEVAASELPRDWIDRITKHLKDARFAEIKISKKRQDKRLFLHNLEDKRFKDDVIYAKKMG